MNETKNAVSLRKVIQFYKSLDTEEEIWRPNFFILQPLSYTHLMLAKRSYLLQLSSVIRVERYEAERLFSGVRRHQTTMKSTMVKDRVTFQAFQNMDQSTRLCQTVNLPDCVSADAAADLFESILKVYVFLSLKGK